ncbi:amidohydrolase family protein [Sphingomonas montanisoli]|uniref:amidohydrolase family protein n=1 Tax=Sphingomonas montanisoli TaxID=2606412 RepID=UPI001C670285|nr:amidohydrolase family protein [Sphingomonas montanisoli]
MSDDPYILITADTHAGANHATYREYLDPQYRQRFDEWRGAYKNPQTGHYGTKKLKNWDFEVRSQDQNSQGVVGEVIYPNTVPPFWKKPLVMPPAAVKPEDYELYNAGIRAHNRWLADFCAEDPVRRAGIGVFLPNDLDEAVKDIEFIAKAGLRGGVLLPLISPDATWLKRLYDPAWERVFAAIQDHDLVMNQHTGAGIPDHGTSLVGQAVWMSEVGYYAQAGYRYLLLSGVFERYPKLKYILTESGCAWAGPMLQQLDGIHKSIMRGVSGEIVYDPKDWVLKKLPSEYAKEHCFYGASFPSKAELDGIEAVGEDNVLWGNDYPHYEGTYPYTLESLRLTFDDMSETRRRKVLGLNAAKLYKFDLEALKPLAAKYGPTKEQVDQPLPHDQIPEDTYCYLFSNIRNARAEAAEKAKAAEVA